MRFGLDIPNFGDFADVRTIGRVAAAAERGGWDGFFMWDHIAPSFTPEVLPTADVTVALTAVALATERIRFGALVTALPRRRPQKVARELASLDRLSGGRIVLGVGLGYPPDTEFAAFGEETDARVRAERLDESLDVVTRLWRGEPVDVDGRHLHVHTTPFEPRPVQAPRIPVWVAATWPGRAGPLRRAARWDGVVPIPPDPMRMSITADDVRGLVERLGRGPGFDVVVTPTAGADHAEFEAAGATWWLDVAITEADAMARAEDGPRRG